MPDQSSQAEIIEEFSSEATSLPEHDDLGEAQKASTSLKVSPSTSTTGQDEVASVHQVHLAPRSPSAIAPSESRLRVRTDLKARLPTRLLVTEHVSTPGTNPRPANTALTIPARTSTRTCTPSLRSTLSPSVTALDSVSPSSSLASPFLGPMAEITPLPSPLMMGDSPGPWHDERAEPEPTISSGPSSDAVKQTPSDGSTWSSTPRSREKRKRYPVLIPAANEIGRAAVASDARNRSISEYTAEATRLPRPRIPTLSGPRPPPDDLPTTETRLTREEYLADGRGLAPPTAGLPSPPPSDRSKDESDRDGLAAPGDRPASRHAWSASPEWFVATTVGENKRRRWRALRLLGQGTFSKVILAISDGVDRHHDRVTVDESSSPADRSPLHDGDVKSRELVAVKVVEHGPAGGASEERVESSLKRELEIMRSIHHPSLVQLKAVNVEPSRALLVLRYCPGGDLFDLASQTRSPLSPSLIGRIFSELVTAVLYLHTQCIVHRDIKLENVLLNLPVEQMREKGQDWQHHPSSVVTLTDLGLSRRVDPDHPQLHTRCGSEDYAAPELLMGQPYDGRQTDAWALGVLLYALMEGRLPFDPPPGASEQQRMRSRTVHRIARCDWSWCKYADEDGEPGDFGELEGARSVVDGLLRRVSRRLTLDHVADTEWVRQAVQVQGGIRFQEDHLQEWSSPT